MKLIKTSISGLIIIEPKVFSDSRGFFYEPYNKLKFDEYFGKTNFVQDNESKSVRGVLRGFHFQKPPFDQAKLVRCIEGKVLDFALDLRKNSPTYLQHHMIEISEKKFNQVYIPSGFAHGFLTLEEDCEIFYKTSNYYSQEHDVSLAYFDESLNIFLPCSAAEMTLSQKDKNGIKLDKLEEIF